MKFYYIIDKYMWVLNLVLIALVGWGFARVTSTGVRTHFARPSQIRAWQPPDVSGAYGDKKFPASLAKIEARNILKAKIADEVVETASANDGTPRELTPLNLKLQGIAIGPGWAFATIYNGDSRKTLVLGVGGEVQEGSKIISIKPIQVTIERENGSTEELFLEFQEVKKKKERKEPVSRRASARKKPGSSTDYGKIVKKISDTEYLIDQEGFHNALENMNELLTQARLVPNFNQDRQVDGFRIMRVRGKSIFYELGLRNRDIIQRVNGIVLDDPAKGLEFFQMLKDQNKFTIDLKRNNESVSFNYEVR